jgi:hypothetical protein
MSQDLIVARVKVSRAVWRRLRASAILEGVSVAELAGRVLLKHTMQCQAEVENSGRRD